MRFDKLPRTKLLVAVSLLALAIPVLGQDAPESILPPGFGDPVEETPARPGGGDDGAPPQDLIPDGARPRTNDPDRPRTGGGGVVAQSPIPDGLGGILPSTSAEAGKDGEEGDELAAPIIQDLPEHSRRSTAQVGVLGGEDGDLGNAAFGNARGPYLVYLMHHASAPLASRWGSILLRRALLSRVATPAGVGGADFAAERAWLLLRMGESDSARMLAQAVDADQYTPWMRSVAQQAALASADPAGMCPATDGNPLTDKDAQWKMARAICSAFSGETSLASALVDQVRDHRKAPTIDVLLAEKVVGAASNSRRSVNILWENVDRLSAWRFGLASATALKIPDSLMRTVGPNVRAWRARTPLLPVADRAADAEIAAALGVFSGAALLDHYAAITEAEELNGGDGNPLSGPLAAAFAGESPEARLSAIKSVWENPQSGQYGDYARLILTGQAAARLPVGTASGEDADRLVASMFSAGLDMQAEAWKGEVSSGGLGWALIAVGGPSKQDSPSSSNIRGLGEGLTGKRAQFFAAGLAGMGRISADAGKDVASDFGFSVTRADAWTRAIAKAADAREPATVAVLAAMALQGGNWKSVSPAELFHLIAALRKVGLDPEARMIAAEAVMRG